MLLQEFPLYAQVNSSKMSLSNFEFLGKLGEGALVNLENGSRIRFLKYFLKQNILKLQRKREYSNNSFGSPQELGSFD